MFDRILDVPVEMGQRGARQNCVRVMETCEREVRCKLNQTTIINCITWEINLFSRVGPLPSLISYIFSPYESLPHGVFQSHPPPSNKIFPHDTPPRYHIKYPAHQLYKFPAQWFPSVERILHIFHPSFSLWK